MGKKTKRTKGQGQVPEADKSAALNAALELADVAEQQDAPVASIAVGDANTELNRPSIRTEDEVVKDKKGNTLFIRKAPTLTEKGQTPTKVVPKKTRNRMKTHSADGTHVNPRYLKFPADKWGLTKDLKSALIHIASRVAGDSRKMELVNETLRIGLTHLTLKYARDKVAKDARQEVPKESE